MYPNNETIYEVPYPHLNKISPSWFGFWVWFWVATIPYLPVLTSEGQLMLKTKLVTFY